MICNPIGRAIHDNTVFNCFGKHISPIANAVYILRQMKYISFGKCSIYSMANAVYILWRVKYIYPLAELNR